MSRKETVNVAVNPHGVSLGVGAGRVSPGTLRSLRIEERMKIVAANLLAGATVADIAEALGISQTQVRRDIKVLDKRWQREQYDNVAKMRRLQIRRLMTAMNAIFDKVQKGDMAAIDKYLKITAQLNEIMGVNAPQVTQQQFLDAQGKPTNPVIELQPVDYRMAIGPLAPLPLEPGELIDADDEDVNQHG